MTRAELEAAVVVLSVALVAATFTGSGVPPLTPLLTPPLTPKLETGGDSEGPLGTDTVGRASA
jgi:hypothetical protein